MPTILDSLFHKVVNTTSSPIGVEGGGWWGATKWQDPMIQKLFMAKWLQFKPFNFSAPRVTKCSYIHQCPVSSASLVVIPCRQAVCLAGQVGAIYRPPDHPWMPDRPVNVSSVKADR